MDQVPGYRIPVTMYGNSFDAFVPNPLPPAWSPDATLINQLIAAERALGRLNGLANHLPNPYLLVNPYIRKEAVASSRIEGTRTDYRDLLEFEADQNAVALKDDATEVRNYVRALEYALAKPSDRPVSISFIREIHQILMEGARGSDKRPGELRDLQVYISGQGGQIVRFIPPPPDLVEPLMRDLESYIALPDQIPELVRIALIHYQFEAIHPFLDGNGRVGRLLISVLLGEWNILSKPVLYLSDYLERNRQFYLLGLQNISDDGDWETYIRYFLQGVQEQSDHAVATGQAIVSLREHYRLRLRDSRSRLAQSVMDEFFMRPIASAKQIGEALSIPRYSAQRAIDELVKLNLVSLSNSKQRSRLYAASEVLQLLDA